VKMRKNYFVKLIKYMKNVYNIEHGINKLTDGRVNPKYKTSQVCLWQNRNQPQRKLRNQPVGV
jgi:hypothetical protein